MPKSPDPLITLLKTEGELSATAVGEQLGISRQAAHRRLRALVDGGVAIKVGAARATRYRLAEQGPWRYTFRCEGLEEHLVWEELSKKVSPLAALEGSARDLFHYALTELVNNAIDHSTSAEVTITISCTEAAIDMEIVDKGVGVFNRIQRGLDLASPLEGLWELSKGKTTTDEARHSGEGLFFVSKAADIFRLESGALAWIVDNDLGDHAIESLEIERVGTRALFRADPTRAGDLKSLFEAYTDNFEFSRTRMIIKLFEYGTHFISRSEAKRLMYNLERFRHVTLDFKGVDRIGQAFADEVFRVWATAHPETEIAPTAMNEAIAFMIERTRSS